MSSSSPSAQIGRYGTISLMKRQDPSTPLTAFGIDTPELTFGRDPSCGVRLYYAEIAVVHSRIVFDEDRKAFMCVLGESGVIIDGCFVKGGGEMVPLMNGSEFEIRGKRFRFSYPPKEIRAALYASPIPTRAPRLSLITSTHVFSPRPSPDPRENLRILKSPLKNTFKALKRGTTPLRTLFANASSKYEYNSPVKSGPAPPPACENEEEDSIVLVDGNHPRVVEDEKDLVILEHIDRPIAPSLSSQHQMFLHAPQPRNAQQEPPKTPVRRRSQSLHRAVLIRSAQRAVMNAERDEREREEEEMEEMEVLDVVAGLGGEHDNREEESEELRHEHGFEQGEEDMSMDIDMDVDVEEPLAGSSDDEQQDDKKQETKQKLTWRKSFERLWPFRSSSPVKVEEDRSDDEQDNENENENENEVPAHARTSSSPTNVDEEDENEDPAPLFAPPRTPHRPQLQHRNRAFGPFMTPQPRIGASMSDPTIQHTREQDEVGEGGQGRFSLGGGQARRVVAESQVWRVKDIVVPPPSPAKGAFASPVRQGNYGSPRKVVDEDERKAIQERRRSALREPSGLGFVPGFSPMKMKAATRVFSGGDGSGPGIDSKPLSLMKPSTQLPNQPTEEKEEEEDTRRLLERMRETVEGMKRRRSEVPPQIPMMPSREMEGEISRGRSPVKKGEVFSLLRTEETEEGHGEAEEETKMASDVEVEEVTSPREDGEEKDGLSVLEPVQHVKDVCTDIHTRVKPRSRSTAKSPAPLTHQEVQDVSTVHEREKLRSKSKARSSAPICLQEVDVVSMEPGRKPRSKSKAKSPTPFNGGDDQKVGAAMEESHFGTDERTERAAEVIVAEPEECEPAQAEKPTSKPHSRSKSRLRAPASKQTISEPKQLVEETRMPGRSIPAAGGDALQPEEAPVKRGRKAATTTPVALTNTSQAEPAPTRRGRKPAAEPKDKEAPKRGRKLGVTTAATALSMETDAPKRSLRKTPAPAPIPVVENGESVKRGRTPRAGSVVPTMKPTAKASGVVNGDDGKVTVKGRKRAGTIKKEDVVGSMSRESVASMTTTTMMTNAMGTKARTPAIATRMRKTPASVPVLPMQEVNKENENGEEEGVKVRISRKGRGKKAEDSEIETEAGKARVGRTTRARTRTQD